MCSDSPLREGFSVSVSYFLIGIRMREYFKKKNIKPVLRFFVRVGAVVGVIFLFDVTGLWIFLSYQGLWNLPRFTELLALILLLEGSVIGVIGAFMFYGYSEYALMRQAALWPSLAGNQARGWRERRLSQQKWGVAMLIAAVLLILLFLTVSFLTPIFI